MSEKRYFKVEYDEEWYLFDSNTISEELVVEQAEYGYGVFANSLSPSEICERLNEQQATINKLKEENERLKEKLNVTALELVDEAISMGKAVEISEMNYHEFLEYRKKKGKAMELQR